MTTIAGVEEAGRGPVIGPLVMAGVLIEKEDEAKLRDLGVKDSKMLSPSKREMMFDRIKEIVKGVKVIIIEPAVIDFYVESENKNLNWLEADKTIEIVNALDPDVTYLDCPSNNIMTYMNYVRTGLKIKTELHAEHKADEKYLVVGAASIIAKVTRDREIDKIKKNVGENFGSGYPSDPITRNFLEENWEKHPKIFRHSWEPYRRLSKVKSQSRLGEFRR